MAPFDPVSAALGGALIGLSATMLIWLNGRIAGISGIFGGALTRPTADRAWRIAFLIGLIAAPGALALFGRGAGAPALPAAWPVIVAGGLLVGFGSRLGGGCTSGHGVCGTCRLSVRSIVATVVFMLTAMAVVAVMRHGAGS